jgi:hypothetical protein
VKAELWRRMHDPIPEVGKWLRSVVGGHVRYYGVLMNNQGLRWFSTGTARWRGVARLAGFTGTGCSCSLTAGCLLPAFVILIGCAATWGHHLRQEPDAGMPLVPICGGGHG